MRVILPFENENLREQVVSTIPQAGSDALPYDVQSVLARLIQREVEINRLTERK